MNKVKKIAALLCIVMSAVSLPNHIFPQKYAISIYFLSRLCKQNYCYKPCNNIIIIQEDFVQHEFFLLIFTVHKQILFHECEKNSNALTKTTFNTILEISERINQIPIAEVLNVIDMLVRELPPFLEKYEFHSTITWRAWFKKYWWVPPVFGAWFGLKILLSLQRPQFYYSSYLLPKPQISLQPIITNDPALLEIRRES